VTAGKVHTPFKTELLNTIGGERFAARPPHLVGILATKKEDARTYAEVSKADSPTFAHSIQGAQRRRAELTKVHQKSMRADWDQFRAQACW